MKTHPINRLEEALQSWEDRCAIVDGYKAICVHLGVEDKIPDAPFIYAPLFRSYLLGSVGDSLPAEHVDPRFLTPSPADDRDCFKRAQGLLTHLTEFSLEFSLWTRSSRRAFHLTEDLSRLLNATSLDGLCWEDIDWPFPSFAITLAKPLVQDGIHYDCLLVSRIGSCKDGKGAVFIDLFSSLLAKHMPFHRNARLRIQWLISKQRWREAYDEHHKWCLQWSGRCKKAGTEGSTGVGLPYEAIRGRFVTDSVKGLREKAGCDVHPYNSPWNLYDRAIRLAVNLCAYLATIPAHNQPIFQKRQIFWDKKQTPVGLGITEEAEICTVTAEHFLTSEERQVVLAHIDRQHQGGYTLPVHWRRAHRRREKGHGHDPNAPRTVKVKAALVNGHLLQEGILPGGSKTTLR